MVSFPSPPSSVSFADDPRIVSPKVEPTIRSMESSKTSPVASPALPVIVVTSTVMPAVADS